MQTLPCNQPGSRPAYDQTASHDFLVSGGNRETAAKLHECWALSFTRQIYPLFYPHKPKRYPLETKGRGVNRPLRLSRPDAS